MCSGWLRAGCALLLAVLAAGCGTAGQLHPAGGPEAPSPVPAVTSTAATEPISNTAPERSSAQLNGTSAAARNAGAVGPIEVAMQWLAADRQASWTEPATAWIARVQPYGTARQAATNQALAGHSGGAAWAEFVADRCTSTVIDLGGVIPPEAPRTDHAVHVQVAGVLRTRCAAGAAPEQELIAATVTVLLTSTGWRVDRREQ